LNWPKGWEQGLSDQEIGSIYLLLLLKHVSEAYDSTSWMALIQNPKSADKAVRDFYATEVMAVEWLYRPNSPPAIIGSVRIEEVYQWARKIYGKDIYIRP